MDSTTSHPEATANNALAIVMRHGYADRAMLEDAFAVNAERAQNLLDEMYAHQYLAPCADMPGRYTVVSRNIPAELRPEFRPARKTIEELYGELARKIAAGDPQSRTVAEFNKGIHAIGKKIVEEAAEVWMSAEYESPERTAEETSQLLYHLLVLMLKRGITPEDLYKVL